ncbi:helix-turn-helix transcriptional regulator [Conexibacter sp. SYSU D00693]|uniref:helix-turn-helix transcriptional regulator n=1 Tax=Conexibacter sp. SYSU D00693 TaxID=2812560 RepID=UPI00196ACD82|nr:helix-turn-helix transcriptional regulator [Conexibacter sp. SYSU D00693]
MTAAHRGEELLEGRRALERAEWAAARATFESALAAGDCADAHDGLGQALWMLGEVDEAIARRGHAFDGLVAEGRCDDAARVAVWVAHQHLLGGRASASRGWLARAERALDGVGSCAGHGWVAAERARQEGDVREQVVHARRAMEIGRRVGDGDLEVFALSILGRAVVLAGRREDGLTLLEEAMAAAASGAMRTVHTLAEAYCNLLFACTGAGEWERANEWYEVVAEFAVSHGTLPLLAACRTDHANVLLATGRWVAAEDELESAMRTGVAHARQLPELGVPTQATMAELRVRQGRLLDAARLLSGREEHPESLRALALLRIAEGRPQVAAGLLSRGLRSAGEQAVRASQLLAPLVDALLQAGDLAGAGAAAAELEELAATTSIRLIGARAALARARVARALGRGDEAADAAGRALSGFSALAMPFESAEARLELARSSAVAAPDLALEEARSAFETFRDLGAARAMDAAAGVLRDLGAPGTTPRARVAGELTRREQEVLDLLALGMTNAQVAERLVISEKTAGHHVSRILMKLGVRNRAEAAAYAARAGVAGAAG